MGNARRLLTLALLLTLTGCTHGDRSKPAATSPGSSPDAVDPTVSAAGRVVLPGQCAVPEVTARLRSLVADLGAGNGTAVAAHFLVGPDLRWEVYQHLDPPNGSKGALRTPSALASFADEVLARHDVWTYLAAVPPVGDAGLPDTAVYGLSLSIRSNAGERAAGAKVVIDCKSGRISHMVGPNAE